MPQGGRGFIPSVFLRYLVFIYQTGLCSRWSFSWVFHLLSSPLCPSRKAMVNKKKIGDQYEKIFGHMCWSHSIWKTVCSLSNVFLLPNSLIYCFKNKLQNSNKNLKVQIFEVIQVQNPCRIISMRSRNKSAFEDLDFRVSFSTKLHYGTSIGISIFYLFNRVQKPNLSIFL